MVHPYRTALRDLDRFNTKLWGFFNGLKNQANTWRTGSQKPANVAPPPRANAAVARVTGDIGIGTRVDHVVRVVVVVVLGGVVVVVVVVVGGVAVGVVVVVVVVVGGVGSSCGCATAGAPKRAGE